MTKKWKEEEERMYRNRWRGIRKTREYLVVRSNCINISLVCSYNTLITANAIL